MREKAHMRCWSSHVTSFAALMGAARRRLAPARWLARMPRARSSGARAPARWSARTTRARARRESERDRRKKSTARLGAASEFNYRSTNERAQSVHGTFRGVGTREVASARKTHVHLLNHSDTVTASRERHRRDLNSRTHSVVDIFNTKDYCINAHVGFSAFARCDFVDVTG